MTWKLLGAVLLSLLAVSLLAGKGRQAEPVVKAVQTPDAVTSQAAVAERLPMPLKEPANVIEPISPAVAQQPVTAVEVLDDSAQHEEPEDDPYEISEFINPPPDDGKVRGSTEAPLTAAEDEPEPQATAEETPAAADRTSADSASAVEATAVRPPYSGNCPSGNSAESPASWLSLSPEQRQAFPRPTLSITAYSSKPQRRFVMVGRQIFREGQALPSGAALIRIQPKTLVLSSAGCAVEIPTRLTTR